MTLLIIRHGESEADLLDVHEGRADFALTPRGHRQAEAMAEYVSSRYRVTAIYSSPLQRARQTAEHLAQKTGLPVAEDDRLMEFNNGLIAGMSRDAARVKYPMVKNLPVHAAVYEQESVLDFRFRADYMLSKLIAAGDAEPIIAVVSHGGMINQLYRAFLRLPVTCDLYFHTGDTGVHEWLVTGKGRRVVMANQTTHIEGI